MPAERACLAWVLVLGAPLAAPAAEDLVLPLDPAALRDEVAGVSVVSSVQAAGVPGPILDLAFLADDRLAVVSVDAVSLYRRDGGALRREAHRPHPLPLLPVRAPAGSVRLVETEQAFWVATNALAQVHLFTWEGSRLAEVQQADALPGGTRYRPGTNVLESPSGPLVRQRQGLAVSPDGRLGTLDDGEVSWTALRVGDAVARPWPRIVAASSPRPPGTSDALAFYELAAEPRPLGTLPLDGSVRALAARRRGDEVALAVAVRGDSGDRILLLRLAREDR